MTSDSELGRLFAAAIADLPAQQPDPARVVSAAHRRRRNRRVRNSVVALAAVVAVVAVTAPVIDARHSTMIAGPSGDPRPAATDGLWQSLVSVDLPTGWTQETSRIEQWSSSVEVFGHSSALVPDSGTSTILGCIVTVQRPQQPLPQPDSSRAVTVGGAPARYARGSTRSPDVPSGVFWRSADRSWVNVRCTGADLTALTALAERVTVRASSVSVPLVVDRMPAGYVADAIVIGRNEPPELKLEPAPGSTDVAVTASSYDGAGDRFEQRSTSARVNGNKMVLTAYLRIICLDDDPTFCVSENATDPMGNGNSWPAGEKQALLGVVSQLRPAADLRDTKTWFDSSQAFPR